MLRLELSDLEKILLMFREQGFQIIGPTIRNSTIIYDEIHSISDLPQGWTDEQERGQYHLRKRNDQAYFGFNVGSHSWKQFLFVPREKLWNAKKTSKGFEVKIEPIDSKKMVFFGARGCDLAAIGIQDKIFISGKYPDQYYQLRRNNVVIVAVNCTQAGNTCFCTSMATGPRARKYYDIALTEVIKKSEEKTNEHYFVCDAQSEFGKNFISKITNRTAQSFEVEQANELIEKAAHSMGRKLDTDGIKELLYQNLEHDRWNDVASRCLSCTNCTLVCPTCFCSSVEDVSDLSQQNAERWRRWDSCFNLDHSYIHGGNIHGSVKSRYRQWMTHKLASWIDQFGMSGCVGCGRCITWCPVGIDITEEVSAIRRGKQ